MEAERRGIVLDCVLDAVAQVLHLGSGEMVRKRDRLMEIGLDSLMAVDLSRRLSAQTGMEMPSTLIFDYPTAEAIAGFIVQRWEGVQGTEEDAREASEESGSARLSEEEVNEMADADVIELLRSRLER
jgi:acyl carrier protein